MYRLRGIESKPKRADFRYQFYPFDIKAEDRQEVAINPEHICRPTINIRGIQTFSLLRDTHLRLVVSTHREYAFQTSIREFRPVGRENCLVMLETAGKLEIYFDSIGAIGNSIETKQAKRRFDLEKVGTGSLSAVDESKRLLAILSRKEVRNTPFLEGGLMQGRRPCISTYTPLRRVLKLYIPEEHRSTLPDGTQKQYQPSRSSFSCQGQKNYSL
jgi:hypothetical protein